ncbi:MAG: class I SAM-dependent rRNA methyltransferase [Trueperaceae bacterium]|nr:class I SAM-dependent rRNA methyltransferase [Trueperaceae bacterium]
MPHATVTLKNKGLRRIEGGHPWVFASDLRATPDTPDTPAIVRVLSPQGDAVGWGLFNPRSKLMLRLLTRSATDTPPGAEFLVARVRAALAYRRRVVDEERYNAFRVIHSEADGLPGLTVDRYDDILVVQQHAAGLEPFLPAITDTLVAAYQPRGILARHDSPIRALEGLPQQINVLYGDVPDSVEYHEGDVRLVARPRQGQKTGAFLDQRENHVYAGTIASGAALDLFCYQGGFALQLARHADTVLAVDTSSAALAELRAGALRNGTDNVVTEQGDVFAVLRQLVADRRRFATIVLDPPAFAKGRSQVARAIAGYKEINLQALQLLEPGGRLLTASCSHHVADADFEQMLTDAAADAGRTLRLSARRSQAACHPEVLGMSESHYLKLIALEALD